MLKVLFSQNLKHEKAFSSYITRGTKLLVFIKMCAWKAHPSNQLASISLGFIIFGTTYTKKIFMGEEANHAQPCLG